MSAFDPYLSWLGIRDPQRPVNHYRLLGIELFEMDRDVIAASADRQMSHVRSYQSGQYAELSQKLLNELTAAKLCLLNPERKKSYDQQLAATKPVAPALIQTKVATTPAAPVLVTISKAVPIKPARSLTPWLILLGSVAVMIGLIVTIWNKFSPESTNNDQQVNSSTPKAKDKSSPTKTPATTKVTPTNQQLVTAKSPLNETVPGTKSTAPKVERPLPMNEVKTPVKQVPTITSPPLAKPLDQPVIGELPSELKSEPTTPVEPQEPVVVQEPKAAPIVVAQVDPVKPTTGGPNKTALATKQKEIRDIFKDEYANRQLDKRLLLAKKLYDSALQQKDDPMTKYALFEEAKDLAIQLGEVTIAMNSLQQQSQIYNEDLGDEQINALISLQKLSNGRPPAYIQAIFDHCMKLLEEFNATDDYDSALKVANMAKAIATKADPNLALNLQNQIKSLTQLKALFAKAKVARDTLRQNPADAEANQIWGEFLCFAKADFAKGLPFLANGTDDDLKQIIRRELANPTDPNSIVVLGDAWWDLAEKYKDRSKILLRMHAADFYRSALSKLTGLAAAKVEKRIKDSEAESSNVRSDSDEQFKKQLLANSWIITWHTPPGTDVLKFLPNGKAENQAFVRWEVSAGELIIRSAVNDPLNRYARIRIVKSEFQVQYYEVQTGRTNTGIMKLHKQ